MCLPDTFENLACGKNGAMSIYNLRSLLYANSISLHDAINCAFDIFQNDKVDGFECSMVVFDHLVYNETYDHISVSMEAFYKSVENHDLAFLQTVLNWLEIQTEIGGIEEVEPSNDSSAGQRVAGEAMGAVSGFEAASVAVRRYVRDGKI